MVFTATRRCVSSSKMWMYCTAVIECQQEETLLLHITDSNLRCPEEPHQSAVVLKCLLHCM